MHENEYTFLFKILIEGYSYYIAVLKFLVFNSKFTVFYNDKYILRLSKYMELTKLL
jgi:hypothetical protein